MSNLLCHAGTWGSVGSLGAWGWIGMILNLIFWIGLFAGLTLLVVRALRPARASAAAGQPTAKEMLQAQYARGDISREEYELRKQDIR
jgi:uncharacterized membrane protein